MTGGDDVVVVERLEKIYREGFPRRIETAALTDVSFSVPRGSIFGLLGPNGAGKSTTIHLLLGFIAPTSGTIRVFGQPPSSPLSRRSLGFLPEIFAFDRFATGRGLLERFDALGGGDAAGRRERVDEALHLVGLAEHGGRKIGTYSKGMAQRIGLGQALLGHVELLILDEPMSGMDPANRRSVKQLLAARRNHGLTTLLSSHILSDVEELADHVVILKRGMIAANAALSELRRGTAAMRVVFGIVEGVTDAASAAALGSPSAAQGEAGFHAVSCADDELNVLLAKLVAARARIVSVNPVQGDLESLFLELTGPERAAEASA